MRYVAVKVVVGIPLSNITKLRTHQNSVDKLYDKDMKKKYVELSTLPVWVTRLDKIPKKGEAIADYVYSVYAAPGFRW